MADLTAQSDPLGQSNATGVTISAPATDPPDPSGFNPDTDGVSPEDSLITYYRVRSRPILDEQLIACPIAAVPGSQTTSREIIRVALPTADLIVEWASWRKGGKPQLPRPNIDIEPLCVLMRQEYNLDGVELEGDQKNYFISSGVYYYVWKNRNAMTMSFPLMPFIDQQDKDGLVLSDSDWVSGIVEAGWPNPKCKNAVSKGQ